MKHQTKKIRAEWQQDSWVILDSNNSSKDGIRVDGAVVNATRVGDRYVEGYIVAVHGVAMEVAETLNHMQISAIGIGTHLRAHNTPAGQRLHGRVNLMPNGHISGVRK